MKKTKASMLLAVVTAFTLLAGCAGNNAGNNAGGASDSAAAGNASGTVNQAEAPQEPVKISIMANLHTPEVPNDKVERLLEEATNTELEFQWVPDGTYDEKMNASFATGTLPHAVYIKNQTSLIMMRDAIRNGQFWEIGPLLADYPNLAALNADVLRNTSVEGKIYGLYQERPLSRQGLIFRKDWADKLGLSAPTTTDEFYAMLKAFKDGDPDGNGANDTIGLTDRSDLVYGAFKTVGSWFGTPNGWGELDGKLAPEFMFPQYMETMKFFKKLHEEGLINQDFPVTSKTDQQNLLITGRAGAYVGSMGDVVSLDKSITEVNPDALLDVQNQIAGPDGSFGVWAIPGYGSVVLFPKSAVKSEEELKSILAFYDRLMSPELANLIYWGVEGEHYTMEEGKVVPIEDTKVTDREVKPYQALQIGGPLTIQGFQEAKHVLPSKQKAEELTVNNNDYLIHDPTAALDSATYTQDGVRLQELIKDATYNFMLGNLDEAGFNQAVDNWLKQGGQKIIDEFNASHAQSQ
ncbi:extracellular solute-binding protein [Paenibacillus abyssi]|uniref:ABC transporter peptide-binding protein YtcQ n=1 Tax=Paenibacillus abyssi TaxID=1340531 RepID=A0A917LEZ0_9BACL|nr:extracellular solute-binding protein [Paenibacillus abyssi]GGG16452.1 putative ABC transporter peptide-binding protein YtcQ [Paenibacillus abyssi]